jgi:hypothetical protein
LILRTISRPAWATTTGAPTLYNNKAQIPISVLVNVAGG